MPPSLYTLHGSSKGKDGKNFRKHAETHPAAEANTSLWTLAFCNAQPRPHCELCFSLEHATENCDEYEPLEDPPKRRGTADFHTSPMSSRKPQICINWNRHSCTSSTCGGWAKRFREEEREEEEEHSPRPFPRRP